MGVGGEGGRGGARKKYLGEIEEKERKGEGEEERK